MRPLRLVLLGLLAILVTAIVVSLPWIDAQRRAVIVLSSTSPKPVLSWIVRVVTGEPHSEEATIAGVGTTIVSRDGKRPAIVLIPGVVEGGRENPDVQRLAHGLARAGFRVFVPDLPGLADGELVPATVKAAVDVANEVVRRDDVRGGRVGFAGSWAGATVGLLAAEDPFLAPRVSVVAGVAPWTAAPNALRLATTGYSLENGKPVAYEASPALALTAARSLVAMLGASTARMQLQELLRGASPKDQDPLRVVRGLSTTGLDPDAAAVVRLLANRNPARFDALYAALPRSLQAELGSVSPLVGAGRLQSRVELATAPHDEIAPPSESQALARASDKVHVSELGSVADGLPKPSIGNAFATNAWLVRAIRAAR
jgi:pimeloyl-ACP methyl ester carboxylesterase